VQATPAPPPAVQATPAPQPAVQATSAGTGVERDSVWKAVSKSIVRIVFSSSSIIAVAALLILGNEALNHGLFSSYYPKPGDLSATHAEVVKNSGLGNCSCHDKAGLAAGCLTCHVEINGQLPAALFPCAMSQNGHGFTSRASETRASAARPAPVCPGRRI
jgi:hypothetical protein